MKSNVFTPVCDSVHGGWGRCPEGGLSPGGLSVLLYGKERAVRILLDCMLVVFIVNSGKISNVP